eukprot:gene407-515_t
MVNLLKNEGTATSISLIDGCTFSISQISSVSNEKQINQLIDLNVVPLLVSLISSSSSTPAVINNSVNALEYIANGGFKNRDIVRKSSLDPLLNIIKQLSSAASSLSSDNLEILKRSSHTLMSLFKCKHKPNQEYNEKVIPVIIEILFNGNCRDEDLLSNLIWSLSYIFNDTNHNDDELNDAIEKGLLDSVFRVLNDNPQNKKILSPSIKLFGNCLSRGDEITQLVLDYGILNFYGNLLKNENIDRETVREVCWAISNITAGTQTQIQQVLDSGYLHDVISITKNKRLSTIFIDCIWALSNAVVGGSDNQISCLVNDYNIIEVLTALISDESTGNNGVLMAILKIANSGSGYGTGDDVKN